MAQCFPQDLLSSARAFVGLPGGTLELIKTGLLCNIWKAFNPVATCDVQSLLSDARCFSCLSSGELALIQTQLLCEILVAGSGTGACLVCQSGVPVLPCKFSCGIAYDNDPASLTAGSFWFWDSTKARWQIFLSGP